MRVCSSEDPKEAATILRSKLSSDELMLYNLIACVCVYMCMCVCAYVRGLCVSVCICVYLCVCVCMCVYVATGI